MLLIRTFKVKAFTFTPKIIHILLDDVKREGTDSEEPGRKAGTEVPGEHLLCSNVAAESRFVSDTGNSCEKLCCKRGRSKFYSVFKSRIPFRLLQVILEKLIFFSLNLTDFFHMCLGLLKP